MSALKSLLPRGVNWALIGLGYLSLLALGYLDNLRGPLLSEIMKSLAMNHSQAAFFFALASAVTFLIGFRIAKWLKRYGAILIFRSGLLVMMISSVSFLFANSVSLLMVSASLMGLGFGLSTVLQNAMVADGAPLEMRQRFLSGLHLMYGIAALVSPIIAGNFLGAGINWKMAMLTGAILPLLGLFFSFNKSFVRFHLNRQEINDLQEEAQPKKLPRSAIYLGWSLAFYVTAEILISTRLSVFLQEQQQLSASAASEYLKYFFFYLLSGRLIYTFFKIPISVPKQFAILMLSSLVFYFYSLEYLPRSICFTGLLIAPLYPLYMAWASECFQPLLHSFLGLIQTLSSACIILMNFGFGSMADFLGSKNAMLLGAFFLFLSTLLYFNHLRLLKGGSNELKSL